MSATAIASVDLGAARPTEDDGITSGRECDPQAAGLSRRNIDRIWRAAQALRRSGAQPGISLAVRHNGKLVLDRALGFAQGGGPGENGAVVREVMRPDTPVCLFSASKAVTAVLTHKLAEEGGISLDAPVSYYLPRFARHGKGYVTIADVLAHRAGVAHPYIPSAECNAALLQHPECILGYICDARPRHRGQAGYHAITGGYLLGAIIERVTGESLNAYLDAKLRRPLDMQVFTYGLAPKYRAAAARNYVTGLKLVFPLTAILKNVLMVDADAVVDTSNETAFMDAVIPAGNVYATAEELSRFYQMLLNGGEYGGRQVLAPKTVARLLHPRGSMAIDRMLMIPMRYSEGLMLGNPGFSLYGHGTVDAFGHLGFMSILGWAQPSRGNAVGLLTTGKAVLGAHLLPLWRLLSAIRALPAIA
ncbi:MAG TPA: serine hydrolase domain-containing protein [Nevskiaceae bacterium]|nr:serine hydrolase domain-containing protein [Nevskiaceae bacterium]